MTKRDFTLVSGTVLLMCIPLAIVAHKNDLRVLMPSSVFEWNSMKATATSTGARRPFFDAPTATLDNLECHATTLNPGRMPHAAHQHPEEELIIMKEGTAEVLVNGELKRVGPGSVIFQAANQLHSIKNVGPTPATYHTLKWRTAKTGPATDKAGQ